jgi:hypothetical protein
MAVGTPEAQPTVAQPVYPLPLPRYGEAPYLRPGPQLPSLVTTQIIARRDRGWVVAVTAALVALAAAIAMVAATHGGRTALPPPALVPVDDRPDVIRMTPTVAPHVPAPAQGSGPDAATPRTPGTR